MSTSKMLSLWGIALLFSSTTSAHMLLANPIPFKGITNSPLSATGSDYPCQMGQGKSYTIDQMNKWTVGSQQTLSFSGSAVHGGGSCQLAVTTDKEPTKDSKFKVIYSIEGGCPGVSGPSTFPFTVPKELPNGELTFAWTWFNKVGNREIYMHCAPVTVSGGSDGKAEFDALPDLALANIAVGEGAACHSPEGSDFTFKNPGNYKTRIGAGPFVDLCGGAGSPGEGNPAPPPAAPGAPPVQSGGANNGLYTPPASQAPAPSAPAASAPVPQPAQPSVAPSGPAAPKPGAPTSTITTLITVTAPAGTAPGAQPSGAPPKPSEAPAAPSASVVPPPKAPAPSVPAAQPSQGAGAPAQGSCTTEGGIVCNGADKFGICNHGNIVWQPVAPGTQCVNGAIAKRGYSHRVRRSQTVC